MSRLRETCTGTIHAEGVDLYTTLSMYNFSFWFNGERGVLVLDEEEPVIAMLNTSGDYSIYSTKPVNCTEYSDLLEWSIGLNEDYSGFHRIAENDPLIAGFSRKYRGWRVRSTSLWWSLVIGVCQQNNSFIEGWRTLYKIVKVFNRRVEVDGLEVVVPPTPRQVLARQELLLRTGVGYRFETIIRIAQFLLENKLPSIDYLLELDSQSIEEELRVIKGVGPYTARLAMIMALRRYDQPPVDRWLRRIASTVYGVEEKRVEDFWREKWREWSGLASLALTITLDAEPLRKALARIKRGETTPIEDPDKLSPLNMWRHF